jgi:Leucine-rich repeat (LRR) protein
MKLKTLCAAGALLLWAGDALATDSFPIDSNEIVIAHKYRNVSSSDLGKLTAKEIHETVHIKIDEYIENQETFQKDFVNFLNNAENLEYLNVSGIGLEKVPEEIGNLKNLKSLYLENNRLKNLPKEIGNLENLGYLNLENNSLKNVPEEIGNLKNLKSLYFANNQLVPNFTDRKLALNKNYQLVPFYSRESELSSQEKVVFYPFENGVFSVTSYGWAFIPEEKYSNPEFMKDYVEKLDQRFIKDSPKRHDSWKNRKKHNIIDLICYTEVAERFLSGSILTTKIPNSLYKLGNLEDVSFGQISTVALFMKPLLGHSYDWINEPYEVLYGDWKNTKELDLSNRYLKQIPLDIIKCKNLETLNLSNNNFSEIPLILKNLQQLKVIDLQGNPEFNSFNKIPDELLNKGDLKFILSVNGESLEKNAQEIKQERLKKYKNEIAELQRKLAILSQN